MAMVKGTADDNADDNKKCGKGQTWICKDGGILVWHGLAWLDRV